MKLATILIASAALAPAACGTIRSARDSTTPVPVPRDATIAHLDRSKVEAVWNEHKKAPPRR